MPFDYVIIVFQFFKIKESVNKSVDTDKYYK